VTFSVVIAEAAADQVATASRWRVNRPDSPERFELELEATVAHLEVSPLPAQRHRVRPLIDRTLMRVTRAHVYFTVDEAARVVTILAVWGGPRRRPPPLSRT
jgi:hypothetical protein